MTLLELVRTQPDWSAAIEVALTRPPDVPERRATDDPWAPPATERPRRISDDLLWLRRAFDNPDEHGLKALDDTSAVAVWEASGDAECETLARLRERGILEAAGFLLHDPPTPNVPE